jgi:hypothetical protein
LLSFFQTIISQDKKCLDCLSLTLVILTKECFMIFAVLRVHIVGHNSTDELELSDELISNETRKDQHNSVRLTSGTVSQLSKQGIISLKIVKFV